jgi:hypothetical protein
MRDRLHAIAVLAAIGAATMASAAFKQPSSCFRAEYHESVSTRLVLRMHVPAPSEWRCPKGGDTDGGGVSAHGSARCLRFGPVTDRLTD